MGSGMTGVQAGQGTFGSRVAPPGADWLAVKLWGKVWGPMTGRSALISCVLVGDGFPVGAWIHPRVPFLASDC